MVSAIKRPDFGATFAKGLEAVVRFPLPAACALGFAGLYVADQHFFVYRPTDNPLVFLALGFFAALAGSLFAEQRKWSRPLRLLASAAPLGGVAAIVFLSARQYDDIWVVHFLFLLPGLVLLATVAPFLARSSKNDAVWSFNQVAWLGAALGLAGAFLVAIAGTALFAAVETLFGVEVDSDLYGDVWVICLAVLWPWIALSAIPDGFADPPADYAPNWIRFVAGTLLVPIASIYLVVLYVYVISILFSWDLPRGNVANVACGFAAVGVITHLICYPWRESGSRWLRAFYRYFYVLLFVPIALLAIAVGKRVDDYGVTEERYFLVLAAVWLGAIAVYFSVRGRRLMLVPASLAVLLIASSFGPWGASVTSERSQIAILKDLLAEAGVLKDGVLTRTDGTVEFELRKRISSVLDYLVSTGKTWAVLDELVPNASFEPPANDRPSAQDLVAGFGFDYVGIWEDTESFSFDGPDRTKIDIAGYDLLLERRLWSGISDETVRIVDGRGVMLAYNDETNVLQVAADDGYEVRFDLALLAGGLVDKDYGQFAQDQPERLERAMTLDAASGPLRVRLLVTGLRGDVAAAGPTKISANVILLIGFDPSGD